MSSNYTSEHYEADQSLHQAAYSDNLERLRESGALGTFNRALFEKYVADCAGSTADEPRPEVWPYVITKESGIFLTEEVSSLSCGKPPVTTQLMVVRNYFPGREGGAQKSVTKRVPMAVSQSDELIPVSPFTYQQALLGKQILQGYAWAKSRGVLPTYMQEIGSILRYPTGLHPAGYLKAGN